MRRSGSSFCPANAAGYLCRNRLSFFRELFKIRSAEVRAASTLEFIGPFERRVGFVPVREDARDIRMPPRRTGRRVGGDRAWSALRDGESLNQCAQRRARRQPMSRGRSVSWRAHYPVLRRLPTTNFPVSTSTRPSVRASWVRGAACSTWQSGHQASASNPVVPAYGFTSRCVQNAVFPSSAGCCQRHEPKRTNAADCGLSDVTGAGASRPARRASAVTPATAATGSVPGRTRLEWIVIEVERQRLSPARAARAILREPRASARSRLIPRGRSGRRDGHTPRACPALRS